MYASHHFYEVNDNLTPDQKLKALNFLNTNCFTCHTPFETSELVAPAMNVIQNDYKQGNSNKEAFIEKFVRFVQNPSLESAMMKGAINKYGLMPKLSFKEEDLQLAAQYLFEVNLNTKAFEGDWAQFKNHASSNNINALTWNDRAVAMANGTKAVLGSNLLKAIQLRGTAGAIEFCNLKAIALVDSMAQVYQAAIKRVSDKPRNLNNQADEIELGYIEHFKKVLKAGEKLKPVFVETEKKYKAYLGIETNAMCLKCHGNIENIDEETLSKIKNLYPMDKAIGYNSNEIRGIFVVELNK